ncbi:MAG: autotransporter outer membrane beta-barrel domain-containing protein [Chthoniobacteraceae bacterium]
MNPAILRAAFLSVASCLLFTAQARAVVISSNIALPTDGIEFVSPTRWLASEFMTDGNSYLIDSITLKLQQNVRGLIEVSLYSDAGGRPGEMLMSLSQNAAIGGNPSLITFRGGGGTRSFSRSYNSRDIGRAFGLSGVNTARLFGAQTRISVSGEQPSGLGLEADSTYWIVTRALSGQFASGYTDQETGEGVGYSPTWAHSENSGATWTAESRSPLFLELLANPADLLVTDQEAIASAIFSGLPMVMAQREAVFAMVRKVTRDVNERLFRLRSDSGVEARGGGPLAEPTGREPRWEVFVTAGYGSADNETVLPAAGFQTDTFAETIGAEFHASEHFTIGAAFTYVESNNSLALSAGDVDIEGEALAAYVSYHTGGFYADAMYSFGSFEHDIQRDTLFGKTASAEPNSRTHTLQLNLGYNVPVAGFVTGPYASIDWMIGQLEDYTESHGATTLGSAALRVPGQNFDSLISRIGWQISRTYGLDSLKITPQARVGWAHEYRNNSEAVDVQLATSPFGRRSGDRIIRLGRFGTSATTQPPGEDAFEVGFALGIAIGDRVTIVIDYGARLLQDDAVAHDVSLTGAVTF